MKPFVRILLIVLVLLLSPHPAHAYLDPGAGSVLLQILLGGVAGLLVMIRLWWRNLLALFGLESKNESEKSADESKSTDP
jgi:hypothetical protein